MKVKSNPEEFKLFRSNIVFILGICFLLAVSGLFLAFGRDYLYDNGKLIYALTMVGFVFLVVIAFLRLQVKVAGLANELRRTAEEEDFERNRTLTLINSIKDAVILVDESGHISLYNASALDLLNTNVSISRRHISEVIKPDETSNLDISKSLQDLKGTAEFDLPQTDANGNKVMFSLVASRARSGYGKIGMRGYVLVIKSGAPHPDSEEEHLKRHALRSSWAIIEGSIENASVMLERGNIEGAKKALKTAEGQAAELKGKAF